MKLASIHNIWFDSVEHLKPSVELIMDEVDLIILVDQTISNRGENLRMSELNDFSFHMNEVIALARRKIISRAYVPDLSLPAITNETRKRQIGLEIAKRENCTHFLHIDCDEYWPTFKEAKQEYLKSGASGSVCKMWTYFKKPTLRLKEPEGYYVPFIHRIEPNTQSGPCKYPYWADPTRRVNTTDVVGLKAMMHHMSYVRKDIKRKIRNSSAPHDPIESNEYYQDYKRDLKAGDYLQSFKQELVEAPELLT